MTRVPRPDDFIAAQPPQQQAPRADQHGHGGDEQFPRIVRTGPARAAPRTAMPPPQMPRPQPARRMAPRHDDDDDDDGNDAGGRRWGRILGIGSISAVAIAAAGAAALVLYTPTDLVRDRLIREVKAKTGRDLVIGSSPRVTFWPHVAVSLGNVTLANPAGMSGPPIVTMERLDATIQLWPLLQKRVQVDQLVLQSPTISLTIDGQGRRNWDFAILDLGAPRRVQVAQTGPLNLESLPEELREFAKGSATYRSAAAVSSTNFCRPV